MRLSRSSTIYATRLSAHILYISAGLLLRAETEAELAAILAHEQSHTPSARVIDPAASKSTIVRLGDCVLSQPIAPIHWLLEMRDPELRANLAAVELLRSKGYDPVSVATVFSKLVYESTGWDKAIPSQDLDEVRGVAESKAPPAAGYVLDSSQFALMRERLGATESVSHTYQPKPTLRRNP